MTERGGGSVSQYWIICPPALKIKILKSVVLHDREDQKIGLDPNFHETRSSNGWYQHERGVIFNTGPYGYGYTELDYLTYRQNCSWLRWTIRPILKGEILRKWRLKFGKDIQVTNNPFSDSFLGIRNKTCPNRYSIY